MKSNPKKVDFLRTATRKVARQDGGLEMSKRVAAVVKGLAWLLDKIGEEELIKILKRPAHTRMVELTLLLSGLDDEGEQ